MRKKIKIGIDARMYDIPMGIGRYTRELVKELDKIDTPYEFYLFLNKKGFEMYQPQKKNFHKVLADIGHYNYSEQMKMPFVLRKVKLDLVHFTHFNKSIFYRRPYVVTIHDLTYTVHKKVRTTKLSPLMYEYKHLAYSLAIWDTIKRAKKVIVPTNDAKKDIMGIYHENTKKIRATYESCSEGFSPEKKDDNFLKNNKWGIKNPYFFCVSNGSPHKNLKRLVEAFEIFFKTRKEANLVLAGKNNKFYDDLRIFLNNKPEIKDAVILTGEVTDEELQVLLASSYAMTFASLAEGFGIPVLEGMTSGVPVLTSNVSCLPEVGGEAALYFDPYDVADIADKMKEIWEDKNLRKKLVQLGLERVKLFSWAKMAKETVAVYEEILKDLGKI